MVRTGRQRVYPPDGYTWLPEAAEMTYDPREKFVQPAEGIVFLGRLSDADLREGNGRIADGEDARTVWREISRRDPARWRREGRWVGRPFAEIPRDGPSKRKGVDRSQQAPGTTNGARG